MSKLKKFTVHLHATFTPTAEMDGGKIAVVMGDPEVTECDCEPTLGSKVTCRSGPAHESPGRTRSQLGTT